MQYFIIIIENKQTFGRVLYLHYCEYFKYFIGYFVNENVSNLLYINYEHTRKIQLLFRIYISNTEIINWKMYLH